MKKKFFILVLFAAMLGLSSCGDMFKNSYPILYVVNSSDYSVNVYCDNHPVASVSAHNNSGKVELDNVSINLPVYVEAIFYDSKGKKVGGYNWSSRYFRWNKSYKMTLTNSSSSSSLVEL